MIQKYPNKYTETEQFRRGFQTFILICVDKDLDLFCYLGNKSLLCTNFETTMNQQEIRSKYYLHSSVFHPESVYFFSFLQKRYLVLW